MQTLKLEEIHAAQARLKQRRHAAVEKVEQIEAGHDKRTLAFSMGQLTGAELDDVAVELNYWRGVSEEDHGSTHAYFEGLKADIHEQERADRNRAEMLAQKRSWAKKWNELISRTVGFSELEASELVNGRPADLPGGGPAWYRFESMRAAFGAIPDNTMPFAEYANLKSFHPM